METTTTYERPVTDNGRMAAHAQNDIMLESVMEQATRLGLVVVIFRSSLGGFDGNWRYVAADGSTGLPHSIRDKRVVAWHRARYSKRYMPSICGESEALADLLSDMRNM